MAVFCAAVDLGATSGRVIVGEWNKNLLTLTEVHRFANAFESLNGHDYWNLAGLWNEIRTGLVEAAKRFPKLASVGVDTWGVDHVLLDRKGRLVFPVHAYRDARTQDGLKRLASGSAAGPIFDATGIPHVFYNSSLQLEETLAQFPAVRDLAARCLFLPDYFNFLLSGRMENELSIAGTAQLLDVRGKGWSPKALKHFGIPRKWFSKPIPGGTALGKVSSLPELAKARVVAVPGHDTSCAYDAMPADPKGGDIFISSGTWSLVGFENPKPILGAEALRERIANDRVADGTYRPLKNVIGLWLLERTLNDFSSRPKTSAEWNTLISEASKLPPPAKLLDVTDPAFGNPASMRKAIDAQLSKRPSNIAAYTRLICDSLGQGHAEAIRTFEHLSGKKFTRILLSGGGSKNRLLCQATADASGLPVHALEMEATAIGNIASQLIALGAVRDLQTFRGHLASSIKPSIFKPAR